jgi:hypothetical protein
MFPTEQHHENWLEKVPVRSDDFFAEYTRLATPPYAPQVRGQSEETTINCPKLGFRSPTIFDDAIIPLNLGGLRA